MAGTKRRRGAASSQKKESKPKKSPAALTAESAASTPSSSSNLSSTHFARRILMELCQTQHDNAEHQELPPPPPQTDILLKALAAEKIPEGLAGWKHSPSSSSNLVSCVILAVSLLQRLLKEAKESSSSTFLHHLPGAGSTEEQSHTSWKNLYILALCDVISRALTVRNQNAPIPTTAAAGNSQEYNALLERAHATNRSLVAKLMLTCTFGAMQILQSCTTTASSSANATKVTDDNLSEDYLSPQSQMTCAIAILDRLVHLQGSTHVLSCPTILWPEILTEERCQTYLSSSQYPLEQAAVTAWLAAQPSDEATVEEPEEPGEQDGSEGTAKTTVSKKRARGGLRSRSTSRSPKDKSVSAKEWNAWIKAAKSLLDSLSTPDDSSSLPGRSWDSARLASSRWVGLALTWFHPGHVQLLQTARWIAQERRSDPKLQASSVARLLAIVAESGVVCGPQRPPSQMESFLSSFHRFRNSSKAHCLHLAILVLQEWMQIYQEYCQVHRTETGDITESEQLALGQLPSCLNSLCRSVSLGMVGSIFSSSSSSSPSSISNETARQQEYTRAMQSVIVAKIFQIWGQQGMPVNGPLYTWACDHLAEVLRLLHHQSMTIIQNVEETYRISEPLTTSLNGGQESPSSDPTTLDFAQSNWEGMLYSSAIFTQEHALALMLRALHSVSKDSIKKTREETSTPNRVTQQIISVLTEIVRRAYDTRPSSIELPSAPDTAESKNGGRKRTKSGSGGRKSKQRKTSQNKAAGVGTLDDEDTFRRLSTDRASLARSALTALRYYLAVSPPSSGSLMASARSELNLDQVKDILALGDLLEHVLIRTRLGVSRFASSLRTSADPSSDAAAELGTATSPSVHENEFTATEKNLWSAHMMICQILGRGQAEYERDFPRAFFTDAERKSLLQSIVSGSSSTAAGWPLTLPAAHHSFLLATLTSMGSVGYGTAELYLVKQSIKSIKVALQNIEQIEVVIKDPHALHLDSGILLSHTDARLILLAYSGLSSENQRKTFEVLINVVASVSTELEGNSDKQKRLSSNNEASSFLARIIVMCSAMLSVQLYGWPLRQILLTTCGCVSIQLPSFYSGNEWYYSERSFMGLFGDSACPTIPQLEGFPPKTIKEKTLTQFQKILESAFSFGFETARHDLCHLLFAAWNGLGKLSSEGGLSPQGSDSASLEISNGTYPKRFLELRDDICLIHREINDLSGAGDGQGALPGVRLRSNLKSALNRANLLINRLLSTATNDQAQDAPMSLFCLLVALPSYISSSVAAHTKSGNDFYSTTLAKAGNQNRGRTYSSESDRLHSEDQDSEIATEGFGEGIRLDVVSRLRECCDAFGAAPTHPDWLDISCTFQDGIRNTDAIDNAELALRMLNSLMTTAFEQYKRYMVEALKAYRPDAESNEELQLAIDLLPWHSFDQSFNSPLGPGVYAEDREWKDDISALCDLPDGLLELFLDESLQKNTESAREAWCQNASQRLFGHLQDKIRPISGWESSIPELRAGGEWELLLADALTTACLDVKRYPEERPDEMFSDEESKIDTDAKSHDFTDAILEVGHASLRRAQIWHLVLTTALSHAIPAASLLRMGINKTGRRPHPFSFHENKQDPYDAVPLIVSERLGSRALISDQVLATTHDCLATLSQLSAFGLENLTTMCYAAASQLVPETKTFEDFGSLQAMHQAFVGLRKLVEDSCLSAKRTTSLNVYPYIVERLTQVVENLGHADITKKSTEAEGLTRWHCFVGANGNLSVETVAAASADAYKILKGRDKSNHGKKNKETWWTPCGASVKFLSTLVAIICGSPVKASDRSRACATLLLDDLLTHEWNRLQKSSFLAFHPINHSVTVSFDSMTKAQLKNVILEDLCGVANSGVDYPVHQRSLSRVFVFMTTGSKQSKFVYRTLLDSFGKWRIVGGFADLEQAMDLLLALACKFNSLNDVGSKLLEMNSGSYDSTDQLQLIANFFTFIKNLKDVFGDNEKSQPVAAEEDIDEEKQSDAQTKGPLATNIPRRCTFVEKTGYHGQHWYNCYTCGLVWEKGCCTLCALVCHKDHDVSYSRHSSFFCDCAAEDGTASSQSRASCRCMSEMPVDRIREICEMEKADINMLQESTTHRKKRDFAPIRKFPSLGIEVLFKFSLQDCKGAVSSLSSSLAQEAWFLVLFGLLEKHFVNWRGSKQSLKGTIHLLTSTATKTRPSLRVSPLVLRQRLRDRYGVVLDLKRMHDKSMIPVRSAEGFHTKASSDAATNATIISKITQKESARACVVADSRGRMVLAEPGMLVFFSSVPAIAARYATRAFERPLPRQQMAILGKSSISFNIVGMLLCPHNECHLVVWGTSEACVAVLKPSWNGIESKIALVLDLGSNETEADCIVRCLFLPGSPNNLVVGCGRYVRIFDLSRCKDQRANPIVAFNLGFEASLRDIALLPLGEEVESSRRAKSEKTKVKIFMLLENGRLHPIDLKINSDGRIESPVDQPCELSGSISLPIAGVRAKSSPSPVGAPGSFSKSLGEGSSIVFLKQSRLLLYESTSSCVLALALDSNGEIEGSFEMLPHQIRLDTSGGTDDGRSIIGPYRHWTELGVSYSDDGMFFRVACVGSSLSTNQSRLLCIEFNERDVRVDELAWPRAITSTCKLDQPFEGLCALSMPFIGDAFGESRAFGERAFLCAPTSSGSLLFFGEEGIDTVESTSSSGAMETSHVSLSNVTLVETKRPIFPLTIFEHLKNISDSEELTLTGEATSCNSDELKAKLMRGPGSPLVCHGQHGCSVAISLHPSSKVNGVKTKDSSSLDQSHAIVAIRILVGCNVNQVPSRVTIQGRPLELKPRLKKWYSLPLTNEEISLGVRNKMVFLSFGPSFDPSGVCSLDAIEVYAKERSVVNHWVPKSYYTNLSDASDSFNSLEKSAVFDESGSRSDHDGSRGLLLSCQALTILSSLSQEDSSFCVSEKHRDILKSLVEGTSFTQTRALSEAVRDLVTKLEPDDRLRSSIYDESILRGWMKTLTELKNAALEILDNSPAGRARWHVCQCILRECIGVSLQMARERPVSYLKCMELFSEKENSEGSIAWVASGLIVRASQLSLPCHCIMEGPNGIIDLCLTELAIDQDSERGTRLANFGLLTKYLDSPNPRVFEMTCRAISSFFSREPGENTEKADMFRVMHSARQIAYQCDCCNLCPMKDVRYTCLEKDFDIDLCFGCFTKAKAFAEQHSFNASVEVIIEGKAIGSEQKLNCAQVQRMESVPLEKMYVAQSDPGVEDDEELQKALRLSLGNLESGDSRAGEDLPEVKEYEEFVSYLFTRILEVLSGKLKSDAGNHQIASIFQLILDLIRTSSREDLKESRARQFAKEASVGMSSLLKSQQHLGLGSKGLWPMITCIRSMQMMLFSTDADSMAFLDFFHSEEGKRQEKTHPGVVCDIHQIPAVRRRSARGKNKDRRFYVCGKEKGQRCNFFQWADESETAHSKRQPSQALRDVVINCLWNHPISDGIPLNTALCELLEHRLFDDENDGMEIFLTSTPLAGQRNDEESASTALCPDGVAIGNDDGVFCSREKLHDDFLSLPSNESRDSKGLLLDLVKSRDDDKNLLEACLDLLCLVADHKTDGILRWFALLCEIDISATIPEECRALARKVLKSLCGKKHSLYHSMRDHFSFGFHFQALFRCTTPFLEAGLLIREQAHACGPNWNTTPKPNWSTLSCGGLIGSDELVPNSEYSPARLRKIGKTLDELWTMVKDNGESWRRFCSLAKLPPSHRTRKQNSPEIVFAKRLANMPPIVVLFWTSCVINGPYQVKALRLIDFALVDWTELKTQLDSGNETQLGSNVASIEKEMMSMVSGTNPKTPETLLFAGERSLRAFDLISFVHHYVLQGKSTDLRQGAYLVASKGALHVSHPERWDLFRGLVSSRFLGIGTLGKGGTEYFGLLQLLVSNINFPESVTEYADLVLHAFLDQIDAVKYDKSNGYWVVLEANRGHGVTLKRKFDLWSCSFCLKSAVGTPSPGLNEKRGNTNGGKTSTPSQTIRGSSKRTVPGSIRGGRKWHREQVCPIAKQRLDSLRLASSSNEFNTYFTLRHRIVLSDIALNVSDARGRFVKEVTVHYTPHPAKDATELKSDQYAPQWIKCATMALSRGASRAVANLVHPVIAANIRFEFSSFYERPGGSKASDGSLLVHCPRCSRVVTNAHGVCGHCGEVAFQCRKCRHINYDRLDAFLCVECGYCASGSFSFEVHAAVATNAISVVSDKEHERAVRILGAVNTMHDELKAGLLTKFRQISEQGQSGGAAFSSHIQRAMNGLPPISDDGKGETGVYLDRLAKQGSVVRVAARPESNHGPSRVNPASHRTRSLLRLARRMRSESNPALDRRRAGDALIRQLGRGMAIDNLEDERDFFGLLEEGNLLDSSLDGPVRGSGARSRSASMHSDRLRNDSIGKKSFSANQILEDCQRLHALLREAQREQYQLVRRIQAWENLNCGCLVDVGTPLEGADGSQSRMEPCHCSTCGPNVAYHLLMLWTQLFTSRPTQVRVNVPFIQRLLSESAFHGKKLSEGMRSAVTAVATHSEEGARLVLGEVRNRLLTTQDPVSAEILGKILSFEGHLLPDEFSNLALEVLGRQS